MKASTIIIIGTLGFITGGFIGYLAGLAVGKETNSMIGDNTKTKVHNGIITVQVDAKNAAKQGLVQAWENLRSGL